MSTWNKDMEFILRIISDDFNDASMGSNIPWSMAVVAYREIVRLREELRIAKRDSLPQIEDLHGIDITGGTDPAEYVRKNMR